MIVNLTSNENKRLHFLGFLCTSPLELLTSLMDFIRCNMLPLWVTGVQPVSHTTSRGQFSSIRSGLYFVEQDEFTHLPLGCHRDVKLLQKFLNILYFCTSHRLSNQQQADWSPQSNSV